MTTLSPHEMGIRAVGAAVVFFAVLLVASTASAQPPGAPVLVPGSPTNMWPGADGFAYASGFDLDGTQHVRRVLPDGTIAGSWKSPPIDGAIEDVSVGDAGVLVQRFIEPASAPRPLSDGVPPPESRDLFLLERATGAQLPWTFRFPPKPRQFPTGLKVGFRVVEGAEAAGNRIYVHARWVSKPGKAGTSRKGNGVLYAVDPTVGTITGSVINVDLGKAGTVGTTIADVSRSGNLLYVTSCVVPPGGFSGLTVTLRGCVQRRDARSLRLSKAWAAKRSWTVDRGVGSRSAITRVAAVGGRVYFEGRFTAVDKKPRTQVAALDATGRLLPFAPRLPGPPNRPGRPTLALWATFCPAFTVGLRGGRFPYLIGRSGAVLPWAPTLPRFEGIGHSVPFTPTSASIISMLPGGSLAVYPSDPGGVCG